MGIHRKAARHMPLKKSSSKQAFKTNVREMITSGHPVKQAVAAAYDVKRKAARKKKFGDHQ